MLVNKTQYLLQCKYPDASLDKIETKMELNTLVDLYDAVGDFEKFRMAYILEDGILTEITFDI